MKACLQWINSSVPEKINFFKCYNRMRNLHKVTYLFVTMCQFSPLFLLYPLLGFPAAFSIRHNLTAKFIGNMKYWFHSCPYLNFKIWFQKYNQTKRGELKVMLTHGDWHDFTLSVLKCKEVRKMYRDHPYGPKAIMYHSTITFLH